MASMKLQLNGEDREIPDGWTVAELLADRGAQAPRVAVERNGWVVPRATYGSTRLEEGDSVEIVSFFGGG